MRSRPPWDPPMMLIFRRLLLVMEFRDPMENSISGFPPLRAVQTSSLFFGVPEILHRLYAAKMGFVGGSRGVPDLVKNPVNHWRPSYSSPEHHPPAPNIIPQPRPEHSTPIPRTKHHPRSNKTTPLQNASVWETWTWAKLGRLSKITVVTFQGRLRHLAFRDKRVAAAEVLIAQKGFAGRTSPGSLAYRPGCNRYFFVVVFVLKLVFLLRVRSPIFVAGDARHLPLQTCFVYLP